MSKSVGPGQSSFAKPTVPRAPRAKAMQDSASTTKRVRLCLGNSPTSTTHQSDLPPQSVIDGAGEPSKQRANYFQVGELIPLSADSSEAQWNRNHRAQDKSMPPMNITAGEVERAAETGPACRPDDSLSMSIQVPSLPVARVHRWFSDSDSSPPRPVGETPDFSDDEPPLPVGEVSGFSRDDSSPPRPVGERGGSSDTSDSGPSLPVGEACSDDDSSSLGPVGETPDSSPLGPVGETPDFSDAGEDEPSLPVGEVSGLIRDSSSPLGPVGERGDSSETSDSGLSLPVGEACSDDDSAPPRPVAETSGFGDASEDEPPPPAHGGFASDTNDEERPAAPATPSFMPLGRCPLSPANASPPPLTPSGCVVCMEAELNAVKDRLARVEAEMLELKGALSVLSGSIDLSRLASALQMLRSDACNARTSDVGGTGSTVERGA
ncbi:hypothetical protein C8Q76DRAFT_746794 [Earliella scabrosa]|nr:hypothetical protein C8Q76DRAFT_746794 [Earliella scabrosa]